MKKQEADILRALYNKKSRNQRVIAEVSGYSLGMVNKSIQNLEAEGYITEKLELTEKAKSRFDECRPERAIILAAGFGMRMVPINMHSPKALLEVNGETLIERVIKQLHDVGVTEIYVVVGFMKEQFDYLIDEYNVKLIVNEEYSSKNNLHSLALAKKYLKNAYIVPCDIRSEQNPFDRNELYSWYMVSELFDEDSTVRVNRKMELVSTEKGQGGNAMIGISYLTGEQAETVAKKLAEYDKKALYDDCFWEETLYSGDRMIVQAKTVSSLGVVEINTYEQLREIDEDSDHLQSDAIQIISSALNTDPMDIVDITVLKKGMTNRSFLFKVKDKRYIMRIPGEGTEQLINRAEEAKVYETISGRGICDDIRYIDPENGYKITEFLENSRVCDPDDVNDLKRAMEKLRAFHGLELKVGHRFDIFEKIDFYEGLWKGERSAYRDYAKTKKQVLELKSYIDAHVEKECLTHIDAVPDNFLFTEDGDIRLIDWEYAAMQDPHVDIAMFCIYALYDRAQTERLIDLYFGGNCPRETRIKIYAYIAACGLLWSNWCEYKRILGVEFGEYSLRQYRYAKDYYKIVKEELEKA